MGTSAQIEGTTDGTPPLSEDELFNVLSNSRRRQTIALLADNDQRYDIGDLATEIAAVENDIDVAAVTSTERKRVYTSLQQSHLPKMDAAGVIEFDKQRGTVTPAAALADAEAYLRETRRTDPPWWRYYLGVAAVSLAVLVAAWSDSWLFGGLSPLVWNVINFVAFGGVAVAHWHHTHDRARPQLPRGAD